MPSIQSPFKRRRMQDGMTILLLGPTGSGKSSFIHRATGSPDVKIGDGTLPCTTECGVFETILESKHRGAVSLSFLDTPGFDDIPIRDLKILGDIARHLRDLPPVCGVLHFHRITDRRLMGTSRFNLEMLKTITGEGFSDRVAFVTTMWDTIPADLLPRYEALVRELKEYHMNLPGSRTFKFDHEDDDDGAENSHSQILAHFVELDDADEDRRQLQLVSELDSLGGDIEYTTAAQTIVQRAQRGYPSSLRSVELGDTMESLERRDVSRSSTLVSINEEGAADDQPRQQSWTSIPSMHHPMANQLPPWERVGHSRHVALAQERRATALRASEQRNAEVSQQDGMRTSSDSAREQGADDVERFDQDTIVPSPEPLRQPLRAKTPPTVLSEPEMTASILSEQKPGKNAAVPRQEAATSTVRRVLVLLCFCFPGKSDA